jgi:uracil-DNA glycosylase
LEALTNAVIDELSRSKSPILPMLWGSQAAAKRALVGAATLRRHRALLADHPSPLSARRGPNPLIGCGHFGHASTWLASVEPGRQAIDWRA